jgi:hypothetical protein
MRVTILALSLAPAALPANMLSYRLTAASTRAPANHPTSAK